MSAKEDYIKPEVTVIYFDNSDIITTSSLNLPEIDFPINHNNE